MILRYVSTMIESAPTSGGDLVNRHMQSGQHSYIWLLKVIMMFRMLTEPNDFHWVLNRF